jgi:chemotaxis protein methyltransferase CheR
VNELEVSRDLGLDEIEVDLLLEGVYRRYGIDLRKYSRESLSRRIRRAMLDAEVSTPIALLDRVLHEPQAIERLIEKISVTVTAMFRDPQFWAAFREKVVPHLFSAPFVRIWHAGCSTGEEVYSMAILLEEEGLYNRCRIYATDMNAHVVERAKNGIFHLDQMQEYTENYLRAGGKASFSEYYSAGYDHAIIRQSLRRNIVFAQHNLATDRSFNEFNVILCRNVMIYFSAELQEHVRELLYRSLKRFGVLALGHRETLSFSTHEALYDVIDDVQRIYRKKPEAPGERDA